MATFIIKEESRFTHDCDVCSFVGFHGKYDLWVHHTGDTPTLICRLSDDGPDYKSMGLDTFRRVILYGLLDMNDPMLECYHRSLAADLIS